MPTIIKNELDNISNKIKYYSQLNTDNSEEIKKSLTTMINFYTTNNTKNLTNLTDELILNNKTVVGNNDKYVSIINRTISNYNDDSDKARRKFEKSRD